MTTAERIEARVATLDALLAFGPNKHAEGMLAGLRLALGDVLAAPPVPLAVVVDPVAVRDAMGCGAIGELEWSPDPARLDRLAELAPAEPVPPAAVGVGGSEQNCVDGPPPDAETAPAGKKPHWTQTEDPAKRAARMAAMVAAKAAKKAPAAAHTLEKPPETTLRLTCATGKASAPASLPPRTPANTVVPRPVPNWTMPAPPRPEGASLTAPHMAGLLPTPPEPARLQAVGPMAPANVGGVTELPSLALAASPETADARAAARLERARQLLEDGECEHEIAKSTRLPLREVYRLKGELRRGIGNRG